VVGVRVVVASVLRFWRCDGFRGSGFNRRWKGIYVYVQKICFNLF
jgi:hypothetical protein